MKLRYAIGGIVVAALLAMPAGAAAKKGGGPIDRLAAQQCRQERQSLGRNGFRKRYGTKKQLRNCIRRMRTRVRAASRTAADDCRAELAEIGSADFIDTYGTDETGSDAMEECIAEGTDAILNPDDYGGEVEIDDEPDAATFDRRVSRLARAAPGA